VNPKLDGVNTAVALGESGRVGCSSGFIDRSVSGSLRSCLSGIMTHRGGVDTAVALGESGGVGCSSGLIDHSVSGSLRSHLSNIVTCRGDSCHFPVIGEGCEPDHLVGPSFLSNGAGSSSESLCLGNRVVRMGGIHGRCDDDATGGEGFVLGESSFHFPVVGSVWTFSHSSGCVGSPSVRGFWDSKWVVRRGVSETIRGNSGKDAMGGDS